MFQHLTFTFIFNLTPYVLMKINTTDPPLRYANRNVLPNSNYRHPYFSQFYPLSPRLGTSASGRRIPLQIIPANTKKRERE